MSREVDTLNPQDIEVLPNRRPVSAVAVDRLAESIKRIGLQTPITVRIVSEFVNSDGEIVGGQPVLVAGAHRLEAVKRLGWSSVPCFVTEDESETKARLWEIAENLHRAELSTLERDEQVAEWIKLTEEEQNKPAQLAQVSAKGGRGKEGGLSAASRELGIDRDDARRAVRVASLSEEAKATAKDLGLDNNRSALLKAAAVEPERQATVLRQIVEKPAATRPLVKVTLPSDPIYAAQLIVSQFGTVYAAALRRELSEVA